ncbi:MAG: hypothetical protein CMH34_09725 [Microbacterium sp.]|uniref:hypothetical protein n=1 Tax=Microbacterium aquimaris TaxID=459816 RepID=UPI000C939887|nr:hypothetical protein [Microbacterium aquimaris]MAP63999.1 hypothetical protein [Microbacterium sp.]MDZ8274746.1 hypothetical protein [Microbacterium aquimaris]
MSHLTDTLEQTRPAATHHGGLLVGDGLLRREREPKVISPSNVTAPADEERPHRIGGGVL